MRGKLSSIIPISKKIRTGEKTNTAENQRTTHLDNRHVPRHFDQSSTCTKLISRANLHFSNGCFGLQNQGHW